MTTLAIIGGGIAGRSLIYALAKQKKTYSKILLFDSEVLAHTCSLNSTAIVASRGVSEGHSALGDLLVDGFKTFSEHVENDLPQGVWRVIQYTGASKKLEQFKQRYPNGEDKKEFIHFKLKKSQYVTSEVAYLIDPKIYLQWMTKEFPPEVEIRNDFVTKIESHQLMTQNAETYSFDHLVFAGGVHNQNWEFKTAAKKAQGAYYSFKNVDHGSVSFSLTIDGDNFIYHAHSETLLIGSTTLEVSHEWPQREDLKTIYLRLSEKLDLNLPPLEEGEILVGLREKASKRMPYIMTEGHFSRIGGFYKNGFSLGLHVAQKLAEKLVLSE